VVSAFLRKPPLVSCLTDSAEPLDAKPLGLRGSRKIAVCA
jgi:hypothetical protein